MKIKHQYYEELRALYMLGVLEGDELQEFACHLKACPICDYEINNLEKTVNFLAYNCKYQKAPNYLKKRIYQKTCKTRTQKALELSNNPVNILASLALLIMVSFVSFSLFNSTNPDTSGKVFSSSFISSKLNNLENNNVASADFSNNSEPEFDKYTKSNNFNDINASLVVTNNKEITLNTFNFPEGHYEVWMQTKADNIYKIKELEINEIGVYNFSLDNDYNFIKLTITPKGSDAKIIEIDNR